MRSTASLVGGLFAVGIASYLVYFDYQRRTSPEFRRQLRRKAAQFEKEQEREASETKNKQRSQIESLIEASFLTSPLPTEVQEKEAFFVNEVARADELTQAGPDHYMDAALAFYRALYVYPKPADLLGVYESSIKPTAILEVVRAMVVVRPPPAIAQMVHDIAAGPDLSVE